MVTFKATDTKIPVPFTLIDDAIEEGYENFSLKFSYNKSDEEETVTILNDLAVVSIKDDDG